MGSCGCGAVGPGPKGAGAVKLGPWGRGIVGPGSRRAVEQKAYVSCSAQRVILLRSDRPSSDVREDR